MVDKEKLLKIFKEVQSLEVEEARTRTKKRILINEVTNLLGKPEREFTLRRNDRDEC